MKIMACLRKLLYKVDTFESLARMYHMKAIYVNTSDGINKLGTNRHSRMEAKTGRSERRK
jgi:hypothetical protein